MEMIQCFLLLLSIAVGGSCNGRHSHDIHLDRATISYLSLSPPPCPKGSSAENKATLPPLIISLANSSKFVDKPTHHQTSQHHMIGEINADPNSSYVRVFYFH